MRIRTIKPEFFLNDELAELPALTRLLFIGLWGLADREGRLEDKPRRIKTQVLPYDDCDVDAALQSLAEAGFITRYEVDGERFIEVCKFKKHQRITGSEALSASVFPECSQAVSKETLWKHQGNTLETPRKHRGNSEETAWEHSGNTLATPWTTGKEGKGKERKGVIPPSFPPSGEDRQESPPDFSPPPAPSTDSPPTQPPPAPKRHVRPTAEELAASLPIPAQINSPPFREVWRKWLQIRLSGKIPKRGWAALFADQLDRLCQPDIGTEAAAIASLNQSIAGDYTGIFPTKTAQQNTPQPKPMTPIFR